jgi:hypothetical protein
MVDEPIGRRRWAIAEGYIPGRSSAESRAFESHETACLLNAGDQPIVVQHTRLDSRLAEISLITTVAYAAD